MLQISAAQINSIHLHHVGNKSDFEGITLSSNPLNIDDELKQLLLKLFLDGFKSQEYFNFHHESDISLNEVYNYTTKIFDQEGDKHSQTQNIAKHLYEKSNHPKIKDGELYIVHFESLILDGEECSALGIFKSEVKDSFMKVRYENSNFHIEKHLGMNTHKLDKACLILDTERENGFVVAVIDNTNRNNDAQYWIDDFLHLKQRNDDYYKTQNLMTFCKNFVTNELPTKFEVSKADQVDLLNKSVKFFKDKDNFKMAEFEEEVVHQPEVVEVFKQFKNDYSKQNDMEFDDDFAISGQAVKKQNRIFKSVIKLDKNFHIYIHGNRNMIEQGIDENGRKYYKIFYNEEA